VAAAETEAAEAEEAVEAAAATTSAPSAPGALAHIHAAPPLPVVTIHAAAVTVPPAGPPEATAADEGAAASAPAVPQPLENLGSLLERAGLLQVQTEPQKLADVLARIEREPKPIRIGRERPILPPLDEGPLVQVETRRAVPLQ
jgi:ribonuclease E